MSQRWTRQLALAGALTLLGSIVALVPSSPVSAGPGDSPPMAVWREGGETNPRYNPWDGSTFGVTQDSASVGEFRTIQAAEAPTRNEAIVLGMTDSGTVAGEMWDGTSWSALPFNNLVTGRVAWNWGLATAYGSLSGDGVIVWNNGTTGTAGLSYRVWNGTAWSSAQTITTPRSGEPVHLMMAANPQSDEMTLVVSNNAGEDYAIVWDGATWGNSVTLDAGGGDSFDIDVAYEQLSGTAVVVDAQGANSIVRRWNGTVWSGTETVTRPGGMSGNPRWNRLAGDPTSDNIALGVRTYNADIWLATHDGTSWTAIAGASGTPSGNYPGIDVAFESTSGHVVAAYGVSGNSVAYRTWSSGGGWSAQTVGPNIGAVPNSLTLFADPATDDIMLATNDAANDINMTLWNGSAWATPTELETTSGLADYQPFFFLWNAPTAPPTFVVNSTTDVVDNNIGDGSCNTGNLVGPDPECTLRAAIQEANASAVNAITLPAGTYRLTRAGAGENVASTGDLDITSDLTITGAGAATTIIQAGTNATNGIDRVFDVRSGAAATLTKTTVRYGNAGGSDGGGLFVDGDLTIQDVVLVNNAARQGGGVFINGISSSLTVDRATFTGNTAQDGGGIGTKSGTLAISNSTFSTNAGTRGGGGVFNDAGNATITGSTFTLNTAGSEDGGALRVRGGGGTLTLTNSTLSGNSAGRNGGALANESTTTLLNVTISDNAASGAGGGIRAQSGTVNVKNTVVAGNPTGGNCSNTVTSQGYNLEDTNTCTFSQPGDQNNTNPLLGALADNGGPTFTHALLAGSPAIDAGTNTGAPAVDQRGEVRPRDGDGDTTAITDVGAFEAPVPGLGAFLVNSTGHGGDVNPGNGSCETSTAGECTLRAAIQESNAFAGTDQIHFNIPTSDPNYNASPESFTIRPSSLLPAISTPMVLDASTQPEYAANSRPVIEFDGSNVSAGEENGFYLTGGGITLRGFVINNWGDDAIDIEFNGGNTIVGNYVGTNVTGTAAEPNAWGINFKTGGNIIGGTTAADRNVVSGNTFDGFYIYNASATGNVVQGNYVGTNATGTGAVANGQYGLYIFSGANGNTIGGATPAHGNVISGNGTGDAGLYINGGSTSDNIVRFNRIGTNAAGTLAIPNNLHGLRIENAPGTQVLDNLLSGNDVHGLYINDTGATGTLVLRNTIGTNLAAAAPLPNGFDGVRIEGWANGATIGSPGNGNVIAGNTQRGINLNNSNNNTIQANFIGTNSGGTVDLGNTLSGIYNPTFGSSDNLIGGTVAGEGNTIAFNGEGITFESGIDNAIIGNNIYANDSLGIDYDDDGVTANSNADAWVNYPAITSATESGGTITVDFDLDLPAGDYRIELFKNPGGADPTTFGEGETYVDSHDVVSHPGGLASYSTTTAGTVGDIITTTATEVSAGPVYDATSEFSAAFTTNSSPNTAPTLDPVGAQTVDETVLLSFTATATDTDLPAQTLTFTLQDGIDTVPAGASITTSGDFTWTPTETQGGNTYSFKIRVTDNGTGTLFDEEEIVFTINDTNIAPALAAIGDQTVIETTPLSFTISGTDTDNPVDTLTYTASGLPTGATLNSSTGAFAWTPTAAQGPGSYPITFTVTDDGTGTLSDSKAITITVNEPALTVNSTGNASDTNPGDGLCDTGGINTQGAAACTLRAAIEEANASGAIDAINFNMPTTEAGHSGGIWTISPGSALPTLSTTVDLDATTQPGWTSTPVVELNGTGAGAGTDGLLVSADNSVIRGLAVNRFQGDGLKVLTGAANTRIESNHIGLDATGLIDRGNTGRGIDLQVGSGPTTIGGTLAIQRNVISGNGGDGIIVFGSDGNVIIGNFIGTDVTGVASGPGIGNAADGIALANGSANNTIGQAGSGNVLSGNANDGLEIDDVTGPNTIQANMVGLGSDGDTPVPNGRHGIVLYNGANATRVGGSGASEGNVISGNVEQGIHVNANSNLATANNIIEGNLIGTDASGLLPRGNGTDGIRLLGDAQTTTIGGIGPGAGNVISGNGSNGVVLQWATDAVVAGNIIGLGIDGDAIIPNASVGIRVEFGYSPIIGGTSADARNVISGNGQSGIQTSGTDVTIQGNYVGTDATGLLDRGNGSMGIHVTATRPVIGGTAAGEGNVISGNFIDGIQFGSSISNGTVEGNLIGVGADGTTPIANGSRGIAVFGGSFIRIGGDAPGAGNVIKHHPSVGVLTNATADDITLLGNSISANSDIGFDLNIDQVTPNDAGDVDSGPNGLLNFPEITSATELAGTVTADYDLDVPGGSYRIEFFTNPSGSDPTGYGEGEVFVHADTIAHGGVGVEAFSTTFAGSAGQVITATATRILPGPTYSVTSEFSQAVTVVPVVIANLSGSVLEDVDGDGDVLDDGVGAPNVEVSIYLDQGDGEPDLGDILVTSAVTDASGDWSAPANGIGTYWVAIDSTDIAPAAGYNAPFGISDVWAEQTFGSAGAVSYDGSSYSFAVSAGPLFGGMNAGQADGFPSIAAAEHLHRVVVTGSDITGIDSGFSFQVITNTADDLDSAQHQGSLRQFIENSEAVVGVQASQFVIPVTDPGYSASPLSYTIRPVADLPTIDDQAIVDGTTQSEFAGTPVIELDGSIAGAGSSGLTVDSTSTSVRSFAINRFETGISVVGGADNVIAGNYLGPDVTGLVGQVGNTSNGLYIANATGTVVGGPAPADRNVISGNRLRGLWIDDLSDGPAPAATGTRIVGNYLGTDAAGAAALPFDGLGAFQQIGIAQWDGPGTIIGGAGPGEANVVSGNDWYGIYIWGPNATGNTIQGNIIGLDASAASAVGNGADDPVTRAGVYVSNAPANLIGGTGIGEGNKIVGNDANGVVIHNSGATGNAILGNEIRGNSGLGIDLETDGVSTNDSLDSDGGANDLLNFPGLSQATTAGGIVSLVVQLDVPAGDYRIEFFTNPSGSDPSGYGEGETFRHGELIAHPGGGPQMYRVSFPGSPGDAVSATTTELLPGPTYRSTSEFSRVVLVAPAGDLFIDSSQRHSDFSEVGTIDQVSGKAGIGSQFSGAGDRLVGPATDIVSGELTMSAWLNATGFGTDPRVVAKTASDGNTVYELLVDGTTTEAVARLRVGGSTVEVRGGSVSTGTWHQLLATWDGSTLTLYLDGVSVDSAAAVGTLATDLAMPLVVGNVGSGTRSFNGTLDHLRVSHVVRPQEWVATTFTNINDPASFVTIGGAQTGLPAPWSVSATTSRTGSFALSAPETVGGADAWATAIGIDEPGVEFETWWQLSDPANVDAASGTRTGLVATDQNETALAGSVFDLGSIVGGVRTRDALSATGSPASAWVKVVIRTDETGTSSVWIDDATVMGPTIHSAGGANGSVGLRVGDLPVGETWHIDDVQLRRFVSDEPVATLGPLDRN